MNQKEAIEEIKKLQQAIVQYSERMNNKHYADKTPLEREIDDLSGVYLLHLEKLKNRIATGQFEEHGDVSPVTLLGAKLLSTYNAVIRSRVPISSDVAIELGGVLDTIDPTDNFGEALNLLDLAHAAKNAGKTALAKDKLKGLGG